MERPAAVPSSAPPVAGDRRLEPLAASAAANGPAATDATESTRTSRDALGEETAALREAQAALRAGRPDRALALVREQDVRFRKGSLEQERAAARVLALCEIGRKAEARRSAREFETKWPRSPLLARVRGACTDGEPSP